MITELLLIAQGIIERGLIFSLPAMGLYLSYRIIHFDDLTIEGSFGIGSAITALCLIKGIPWPAAMIIAMITGALAGIITGVLHTIIGINQLISGVITTTGLFSLMLVSAGSFVSITERTTIFNLIPPSLGGLKTIVLLACMVLILNLLIWFLQTQIGFLLRALGDNPRLITFLGKNKTYYTILCLAISNTLIALSGSLFVQYTGYFSIWTSVGILILALASLMLSELISPLLRFTFLCGPIFYQALIAFSFELHLDPAWNKLITALIMVMLFTIQKLSPKH